MTVRIGTVWDSTQQVLAGRAGMMVPFAAIGFVLPSILQILLLPNSTPGAAPGLASLALTLFGVVLGIWGQLAIMALATHPATTSAEASRAGFRHLGAVLGVAIVIGVAFALVMLVLIVVLGLSGFNLAAVVAAKGDPSKFPPMGGGTALFVTLYILVVAGLSLWLAARLVLVYAVVLNERRGLGAIRRSVALTQGLTWRLIGVFLLFGIVMLVAMLAVQGVTGAALRLVLGADQAPTVVGLAALLGSVVSAGFMTLAYVFVARLYVAAVGDEAHRMEDGSPSL
ncbi:hypothetical protein [Sphingomonas fuzhouensis]|uniref:hypothetical protein n=1 Tax=Sphingomonas fuzhouensis TaxID=3106033 RepID=UPI002AFFBC6A|nr:hypothetical protein [Sphingomonas sp. SGZ-02]